MPRDVPVRVVVDTAGLNDALWRVHKVMRRRAVEDARRARLRREKWAARAH